MSKRTSSFEQKRTELISAMCDGCSQGTITKVIRFTNDDVPEFLKRLTEFEERSRNIRVDVR